MAALIPDLLASPCVRFDHLDLLAIKSISDVPDIPAVRAVSRAHHGRRQQEDPGVPVLDADGSAPDDCSWPRTDGQAQQDGRQHCLLAWIDERVPTSVSDFNRNVFANSSAIAYLVY